MPDEEPTPEPVAIDPPPTKPKRPRPKPITPDQLEHGKDRRVRKPKNTATENAA